MIISLPSASTVAICGLFDEYLPVDQYLIPKETLGRCMIVLTSQDGQKFYWHECGGLTTDIEEALEYIKTLDFPSFIK